MRPTIEIIVSPQGTVRVETHGFIGPSCREASKSLEEALGVRIAEQFTIEFYQTTSNQASEHEQA